MLMDDEGLRDGELCTEELEGIIDLYFETDFNQPINYSILHFNGLKMKRILYDRVR